MDTFTYRLPLRSRADAPDLTTATPATPLNPSSLQQQTNTRDMVTDFDVISLSSGCASDSEAESYQSDADMDDTSNCTRADTVDLLDHALDEAFERQMPELSLPVQDAAAYVSAAEADRNPRDIWAEMEQNERMAAITGTLDEIGLREFEMEPDDGDVELQMAIQLSMRENLDVVCELAARDQPPPPAYQNTNVTSSNLQVPLQSTSNNDPVSLPPGVQNTIDSWKNAKHPTDRTGFPLGSAFENYRYNPDHSYFESSSRFFPREESAPRAGPSNSSPQAGPSSNPAPTEFFPWYEPTVWPDQNSFQRPIQPRLQRPIQPSPLRFSHTQSPPPIHRTLPPPNPHRSSLPESATCGLLHASSPPADDNEMQDSLLSTSVETVLAAEPAPKPAAVSALTAQVQLAGHAPVSLPESGCPTASAATAPLAIPIPDRRSHAGRVTNDPSSEPPPYESGSDTEWEMLSMSDTSENISLESPPPYESHSDPDGFMHVNFDV